MVFHSLCFNELSIYLTTTIFTYTGHLMEKEWTADIIYFRFYSIDMAGMNGDSLRYFQIKITYEQAQHLPGAMIIDYFSKVEMIFAMGSGRVISRVEFDDPKNLEENDELKDSFQIEKILLKGKNFAYVIAKTPGPIQSIIAKYDECWVVPPTFVSKEGGFFMTVQGTSKGLKYARDSLVSLIPKALEMRISKTIDADWIFTPTLPEKRHIVMMAAVEMGYYDPTRKCTQKDLAELLGIQQRTVAEHLRYAESVIINSWAKHSS